MLNSNEVVMILQVLVGLPSLSTYLEEYVVDELEVSQLFDVFEQRVTEKGMQLIRSLTVQQT